jgi:hypothetical protein
MLVVLARARRLYRGSAGQILGRDRKAIERDSRTMFVFVIAPRPVSATHPDPKRTRTCLLIVDDLMSAMAQEVDTTNL